MSRYDSRTLRTLYGVAMTTAGAVLAFYALPRGGITWQVLAAICLLLVLGGHLISHSQMREIVEDVARVVRIIRGGGDG